jgi:hypothetical protein
VEHACDNIEDFYLKKSDSDKVHEIERKIMEKIE